MWWHIKYLSLQIMPWKCMSFPSYFFFLIISLTFGFQIIIQFCFVLYRIPFYNECKPSSSLRMLTTQPTNYLQPIHDFNGVLFLLRVFETPCAYSYVRDQDNFSKKIPITNIFLLLYWKAITKLALNIMF